MSLIMDVIGLERLELCTHELEKLLYLTLLTLASTIIKQLTNLVKISMTIRSQMRLVLGEIGPEQLDLFALEF